MQVITRIAEVAAQNSGVVVLCLASGRRSMSYPAVVASLPADARSDWAPWSLHRIVGQLRRARGADSRTAPPSLHRRVDIDLSALTSPRRIPNNEEDPGGHGGEAAALGGDRLGLVAVAATGEPPRPMSRRTHNRPSGATGASDGGSTSRPMSPARTRACRCPPARRPPAAEGPRRCPRSPGGSSGRDPHARRLAGRQPGPHREPRRGRPGAEARRHQGRDAGPLAGGGEEVPRVDRHGRAGRAPGPGAALGHAPRLGRGATRGHRRVVHPIVPPRDGRLGEAR